MRPWSPRTFPARRTRAEFKFESPADFKKNQFCGRNVGKYRIFFPKNKKEISAEQLLQLQLGERTLPSRCCFWCCSGGPDHLYTSCVDVLRTGGKRGSPRDLCVLVNYRGGQAWRSRQHLLLECRPQALRQGVMYLAAASAGRRAGCGR